MFIRRTQKHTGAEKFRCKILVVVSVLYSILIQLHWPHVDIVHAICVLKRLSGIPHCITNVNYYIECLSLCVFYRRRFRFVVVVVVREFKFDSIHNFFLLLLMTIFLIIKTNTQFSKRNLKITSGKKIISQINEYLNDKQITNAWQDRNHLKMLVNLYTNRNHIFIVAWLWKISIFFLHCSAVFTLFWYHIFETNSTKSERGAYS